jgi:hypothetical protein
MKKMFDLRFRRSESGIALVLVTIVLALAMLVLPALLNFMGGAGRSAQIREDRMLVTYAADAGIEEAYRRVLDGGGTGQFSIDDLNGCAVDVEVSKDGSMYKAVSTSTGFEGRGSTIESYFGAVGYNDFLDYAISSEGKITIGSQSTVIGNITSNSPPKVLGTHVGNTSTNVPAWPEPGELADYYWATAGPAGVCWATGTVYVDGDESISIGPCYTTGDLEFAKGTGNGGNVTLNGTLYVQGDFTFGKNLNLFLNGYTIYAEGEITFQPASGQPSPDDPKVYGPGCLIAEDDVNFQPKQGNDEFIFIMSISGWVKMLPNGDFWGSIAGNTQVDLQPGNSLTWIPYPDSDGDGISDLDFPGGGIESAKIMSYIIRQ